jgi:hypothetical protein
MPPRILQQRKRERESEGWGREQYRRNCGGQLYFDLPTTHNCNPALSRIAETNVSNILFVTIITNVSVAYHFAGRLSRKRRRRRRRRRNDPPPFGSLYDLLEMPPPEEEEGSRSTGTPLQGSTCLCNTDMHQFTDTSRLV